MRRPAKNGPLGEALDGVLARTDLKARRGADPIAFVHRYPNVEDKELVGLAAACCAFGNVKAIFGKLEDLFGRLGPSPAADAEALAPLRRRLGDWKHRVFVGEDLARLLHGARRLQQKHGSLGQAFAAMLAREDERLPPTEAFREALAVFCDRIRAEGKLARAGDGSGRRGPAHLLPDVRAGSGAKRLLLYLRWMIRPDDGIDLGLWPVAPARLLVPVDVHIHKLARNVGLTARKEVSWQTATEITAGLAAFDPNDPTRYDFALCHMGMVQRCPSRADAARCEGCGVRPVCIHWRRKKQVGKVVTSSDLP